MPNIFLSSGVRFNPFTYDELVKPLDRLYQEHSRIEEGLSELQTKAGIWEGLANKESDPETYAQYKRYADELRLAANELATQGLTATSRKNLYNMKARYANEITPIEQAYTKREKLAEEQRKLNAQSGFNTRFDNDFSTISLDKLVANPQLSYTGINGDEVVKRTSTMASSIAKAISRMPEFVSSPNAEVNKQYFMQKLQQGATIEDVLSEITGDENAPRELSMIRQTIKGQLSSNPAYDENWVNSLINQGMFSAIGSASYDLVHNRNFASDLEKARDAREATRLRWEKQDRNSVLNVTLPDGTQGYKDRYGFYTKNADGSKNYRYDIATPSGKPTTPTANDVSNMTIEKTAKGNPTGRYLDSKGKYHNADGSICANQRKLTAQEEAKIDNEGGTAQDSGVVFDISKNPNRPFTGLHYTRNLFEGIFGGGWSDGNSNEGFDPKDAKLRTYESLSREPNKDRIMKDLSSYGLTLDEVDIYQDYDWYNDDHWKIVPKGAGPDWRYGMPIPNQGAKQPSQPVQQNPNPVQPDSVPLTQGMFS